MRKKTTIKDAVEILGGLSAVARLLKMTPRAVRKYVEQNKLPRTEATGETSYAATMAKADPRINKDDLLATVYRKGKLAA